MPDSIGANGLIVKTAAEITSDLLNGVTTPNGIYYPGLQQIYGVDINTDSNTSDGQLVGLMTQMCVDIRELIVSVNANFDPDEAQGVILDQRLTINNVMRIGGSYTVQPIDITVSKTVTLQGLDANFNNPNGTGYTGQDDNGNQFILATSITLTAGTTSCDFRAQNIGAISVPINTITNPVTIIGGVTSINNSSSAITIGQNQEMDPNARVRRSQSVALASTGYANGLLGKIKALSGVTEAVLYMNRLNATDGNGIPAHAIWLVVAGGSNSDIGNTIEGCISDGCNMRGAETFNITQPDGTIFTAQWDVPAAEPLYIQYTIKTTVAGFSFDLASIKNYMAANLSYGIGNFAETSIPTSSAVAGIAAQGGGGVPVLMQISNDNATWTDFLEPTTIGTEFTVAAADITITVI